jgi:Mg-chelatase subunit ChlD
MLDPTAAGGSKLDAARAAARAFLASLRLGTGDQAALVAFHADAWLVRPLTSDLASLEAGLAGLRTGTQTRIDRGIGVARAELTSSRHLPDNLPVMVVLTDGRNNPVPVEAALAEAASAKDAGLVLFTIGLGQDLDAAALVAMASRPDYAYFAPEAEELADIYRAIAVAIPCPAEAFWGRR